MLKSVVTNASRSTQQNASVRASVCHVTTVHQAADVRIFERECRSLASSPEFDVTLVAPGQIPSGSGVTLVSIGERATSRIKRFTTLGYQAWRAGLQVDAQIYHFHDPELIPLALALRARGKRIIWDAHEDYATLFGSPESKSWIPPALRGGISAAMRQALRAIDVGADAVVAATPQIASTYTNPNTIIVGNEARAADFAGCMPDFASRTVLYTGQVSAGHCFPQVVEAVRQVPGVRLLVAGRTPSGAMWEEACECLGERLCYAGWLDRRALADVIEKCAVGMVTYSDIPAHETNRSNKFYEFAAAGLPLICTPNRDLAQMCRDAGSGLVTDDFGASAMAAALSALLDDEAQWTKASNGARTWSREFGSWEKSQQSLFDVYAMVLGQPLKPGITS